MYALQVQFVPAVGTQVGERNSLSLSLFLPAFSPSKYIWGYTLRLRSFVFVPLDNHQADAAAPRAGNPGFGPLPGLRPSLRTELWRVEFRDLDDVPHTHNFYRRSEAKKWMFDPAGLAAAIATPKPVVAPALGARVRYDDHRELGPILLCDFSSFFDSGIGTRGKNSILN